MVLWYLIFVVKIHLDSGTGDEEPLVNAAVNGGGRKVLALGDGSNLSGVSTLGTLNLGGSTRRN